MTADNVAENQGSVGRLKPVSRAMKPFTCRECEKEFPKGTPHYNQSDYRGAEFFPVQTKVCEGCAQVQIDNGIEVKEKTKPVKNPVPEKAGGCGKDTIYPKPHGPGMWKCGDKVPIVGVMLCEDCGGFKNG